jgi:hypothetical protein
MPLEIIPGIGVGPIRHGMSPADVLAAFNEPRRYEDWMGGNLNDALLFHGLRLHFDKCDSYGPLADSRLDWIVIHGREDALLFGEPVERWTKGNVLRKLLDEGLVAETPSNGDIDVHGKLGLSFADDNRLVWVEVYHD